MLYETVKTWETSREHILPALELSHGSHNEDDLIAGFIQGDQNGGFKLWQVDGAAMVTNFVKFPRIKIMNLWLAGGDLEALLPMEKQLLMYAAQNGCSQIRTGGREGWGRVLPNSKKIGCILMRELGP